MNLSRESSGSPGSRSGIEISVKGRWITVPALTVAGNVVTTTGRFLRVAQVHDEYWLEHGIDDPEVYIRTLRHSGTEVRPDVFTFAQRLPNTEPRYRYSRKLNSVAAIRLNSFEDWWKSVSSDTRRNVKLSKARGVVTTVEPLSERLVAGIAAMNNEAPVRAGKRFWHYGKTFDAVMKDYSSFADRSEYMCAYFEDHLIAFVKIVYCGPVAAIMQNLSAIAHRDKRAATALMAMAVERSNQKGLSFLTYLQYTYGTKKEDSLTEFKRRCGFEELFVPQFYIPLNMKGRLAIAAGLHRPLGEILPGPVVTSFMWLRRQWYEARAQ